MNVFPRILVMSQRPSNNCHMNSLHGIPQPFDNPFDLRVREFGRPIKLLRIEYAILVDVGEGLVANPAQPLCGTRQSLKIQMRRFCRSFDNRSIRQK